MTHAIANGVDIAIWIIGTTALIRFKSPAWIVTALCAVVGLIAMRYL
jgi:hypothetical protein